MTDTERSESERCSVFGLLIDNVSEAEGIERVLDSAESRPPRLVATPNTDHFLRWQRSEEFRELYGTPDLVVADGMPLAWLMRLMGHSDIERIAGVDLTYGSFAAAAAAGIPVGIIGGVDGAADEAMERLTAEFPGMRVALSVEPSAQDLTDDSYLDELASRLNENPRKIIAICLGSPKQERFFRDLEPRIESGVFLGVGATVDFFAGRYSRAPQWIQSIGLEWAYRLCQEPRRLWRRYLVDNVGIARYFVRALRLRIARRFKRLKREDPR